jgi:hypothetical protein
VDTVQWQRRVCNRQWQFLVYSSCHIFNSSKLSQCIKPVHCDTAVLIFIDKHWQVDRKRCLLISDH